MKIAVDLNKIKLSDGDGRYESKLIENLLQIDDINDYVLIVPEYLENLEKSNVKEIVVPKLPPFLKKIYYFFYLSWKIKLENVDVCHLTWSFGFFHKTFPTISTVFDLTSLHHPELRKNKQVYYQYKYIAPYLLKNTDQIVTASITSKNDIIKSYGIDEDKISCIPLAYDNNLFKPIEKKKIIRINDVNIEPGFLLFVGYVSPKKNVGVIIEALQILKNKYSIGKKLVISGEQGYGYGDLKNKIRELGLEDFVIELGFVDDSDLVLLYQNAFSFIFPSLNEGFGLPILEAFSCGTPVIHSDLEVLDELSAGHSLKFNGKIPEDLAIQVKKLVEDGRLYNNMVDDALEYVKNFSWKKVAENYLKLYEKVGDKKKVKKRNTNEL